MAPCFSRDDSEHRELLLIIRNTSFELNGLAIFFCIVIHSTISKQVLIEMFVLTSHWDRYPSWWQRRTLLEKILLLITILFGVAVVALGITLYLTALLNNGHLIGKLESIK